MTFPLCMKHIPGAVSFPAGKNNDSICTSLNYPFLLAETPVTYEFWTTLNQWAVKNGYQFENDGMNGSNNTGCKSQPLTMINWLDAITLCNAITEYYNMVNHTKLDCVYLSNSSVVRSSKGLGITSDASITINSSAKGFRLPTSLEWELAARYLDGKDWVPGTSAATHRMLITALGSGLPV